MERARYNTELYHRNFNLQSCSAFGDHYITENSEPLRIEDRFVVP